MKIQYLSDIHLEIHSNAEYWTNHRLEPVGDILVLAGDITKFTKEHLKNPFFERVSKDFEQVFIVPGNHEYYNITDYSLLGKDSLEIELYPNVTIYNNRYIKYKGVNFIFTTLWSEIPQSHAKSVSNGMMCYRTIREMQDNEAILITTQRVNELHQRDKYFLINALADLKDDKDPTIIVTHHLPSIHCVNDEFKDSKIRHGFYSEQIDIIKNSKIDYWIYGHSHRNMPEIEMDGTKLVTNQCGYLIMYEQDGFEENKIIQL